MLWLCFACGEQSEVLVEGYDHSESFEGAGHHADRLYDCNDEGATSVADCASSSRNLKEFYWNMVP